jgi:hypothetical protein
VQVAHVVVKCKLSTSRPKCRSKLAQVVQVAIQVQLDAGNGKRFVHACHPRWRWYPWRIIASEGSCIRFVAFIRQVWDVSCPSRGMGTCLALCDNELVWRNWVSAFGLWMRWLDLMSSRLSIWLARGSCDLLSLELLGSRGVSQCPRSGSSYVVSWLGTSVCSRLIVWRLKRS